MCTNCEGRAFDLGIYTGGIRVASMSAGIEGLNFERELVWENTHWRTLKRAFCTLGFLFGSFGLELSQPECECVKRRSSLELLEPL